VDEDDIRMNVEALDDAESGLSERGGLSGMKAKFAQIASPAGMFGEVPNGAVATAALESAAQSMLEQLESAGISVDAIAGSAGSASAIALETDAASTEILRIGPHEGWSDSGAVEEEKFDDPQFVDPMAAFEERMTYEDPLPPNI
jgi:hypothetical protein